MATSGDKLTAPELKLLELLRKFAIETKQDSISLTPTQYESFRVIARKLSRLPEAMGVNGDKMTFTFAKRVLFIKLHKGN